MRAVFQFMLSMLSMNRFVHQTFSCTKKCSIFAQFHTQTISTSLCHPLCSQCLVGQWSPNRRLLWSVTYLKTVYNPLTDWKTERLNLSSTNCYNSLVASYSRVKNSSIVSWLPAAGELAENESLCPPRLGCMLTGATFQDTNHDVFDVRNNSYTQKETAGVS